MTLPEQENLLNMKTKTKKKFDTVQFFRSIKEKLAERMENMTFEEQREFLKQVKEGKVKIV
jgi:uncharacterized ferredoxin-like protein